MSHRHYGVVGYAILLTNDSAYSTTGGHDTADASFRVYQGKKVTGTLKWAPSASKGTMGSKPSEKPVILNNVYELSWQSRSKPSVCKYGDFRYLAVEVKREAAEPRC